MTDVGLFFDIELYQQIVVSRGRIDFRGDFGIRELVGHVIGSAELALDLDEERDHPRLRLPTRRYSIQQNSTALTRRSELREATWCSALAFGLALPYAHEPPRFEA
jgi:hypothetical protein